MLVSSRDETTNLLMMNSTDAAVGDAKYGFCLSSRTENEH